MRVLAGDIGGTKTLLELSETIGSETTIIARHHYDSAAYDSFSHIVKAFITQYGTLEQLQCHQACFGVAGPVECNGARAISKITNLTWVIDSATLERQFAFRRVSIINDFTAIGYGIPLLDSSELLEIQKGEQQDQATKVVIGAGTGLGVAQLISCAGGYQVLATEGGHIDFAPRNRTQMALLTYLLKQQHRVCCEDLLSGPGIVNIYQFLHDYRKGDAEQRAAILQQRDVASAISIAADQKKDRLAIETMEIFTTLYGAIAGNFALSSMARGGIYLAGGIAPKIVKRLQTNSFLEAFNDKGKMRALNQQMPVAIVMNPEVGLIGSRYVANHL